MTDTDVAVNLGFTPERYPPGTHMCFMFTDEVDRRSVVHPLVRAGLEAAEDVYYFAISASEPCSSSPSPLLLHSFAGEFPRASPCPC